MKLTSLLTVACAASAILFTACDKKPEGGSTTGGAASGSTSTGEAPLDRFKRQAGEIKEWAKKNEPDKTNPAAGMAAIGQMVEKMKSVNTDGLPADLKAAVDNMNAALAKMNAVVKDFPKDAEGFQKFMTEKATADPTWAAKFGAEMQTIGGEVTTAGEALKAASKKHGVEFDMDSK